MYIESVSSLNLRSGRGEGCKIVEEDIHIDCDGCSKNKRLGSQTCAITRIQYGNDEQQKKLTMCDVCTDVFVDMIRFGVHVAHSADFWKRKSFTRRVTVVHDELQCFTCLKQSDSHLVIKFISSHGVQSSKRICARCAAYYLEVFDDTDLGVQEFPFIDESEDMSISGGRI